MLEGEIAELVAGLRRIHRDDAGLEVKLASTDTLPKETAQTLCAFANTPGGGALILGLDESRGFLSVGCEHAAKLAADISSLCRDSIHPPLIPVISLPTFEDKVLVVAEVPELHPVDKPAYLRSKGQSNGAYIRISDGDHKLSSYEVSQLVLNRGQPKFDREPVDEATREDLQDDLVEDFLRDLRRSRPMLARRDDVDLLHRCGVLVRSSIDRDRLVPSLGGLIALGRDPQSFEALLGLGITITVYPTIRKGEPGPHGERFLDDKVLEGPAPVLLEEVFAVLLARMSRQGIVSGVGREDRWEYPLEALREIMVNAVAHRDYSPMARGTRIQVEVYPDRLEVISPGGLFGPVSIERLGDDGVASTRNRTLVDILENVRFRRDLRALCEGRATGIPTVLSSLRRAGLAPAEFADRIKDFRVRIPNRALLDDETRHWLFTLNAHGLSSTQEMALSVLRTGRSLTSDEYRIELALDSKIARAELQDLINRGLVRMISQRRWARYALADQFAEPQPTLFGDIPMDRQHADQPEDDQKEAGEGQRRKREVLALLSTSGPLSRAEIAERLGLSDRQVLYVLSRLDSDNLVAKTTSAIGSRYTKYTVASRQW
ncbi:ATP-binding protein [Candidatus Protofrankia californiensis]|uniref:ATP-binding protein n=1 Tax=Candidatus Protofrankia californiensis TaxID=1839754 RepID=UPI001041A611|nr:ATP-binding protein [Candidatus Protofrankia californiensis]